MHPRSLLAPALLLSACLPEPPGVDLEGPRVTHSTLATARSVELPVLPEVIVDFSEPLDPATVHPGSVALAAWELLDEGCTLTPICDEGSCVRGRCQEPSLSASDRNALDRGELDLAKPHVVALELELREGPAGESSRLVIRPQRPLAGHRRHTFLIGTAVRDRSGAPLVDEHDRAVAWERELVTAGGGSSGPEPRLVTPAPGQLSVATNLAHVETSLWPPVPVPQPDATLLLEAEDHSGPVELVEPVDCEGWVPGTCLRWRPADSLAPGVRYRPAGGSLVDRLGRPALLPAASRETWFAAGSGPDTSPPEAEVVAQLRGRCLALWIDAGEPVEALLGVGDRSRRAAVASAGWIGIELDDTVAPADELAWSLELRDLADNHAAHQGSLDAGAGFDPALPRVRITELLANPAGPEPDAEFVELLAGPEGAALDGLVLADVPPAEIHQAWQAGDEPPGDPLPGVTLAPGELAILVAAGWSADNPDDPAPPSATKVLTLDASIGKSGLKNAGEPLTLWAMTEQGPVVVVSYGNWIDTGASAHNGRSVVSGPDGCDLPDRWRSHPQGSSSPGGLP